jgi:FixJ family two-component response regulator
VVLPGAVRLRCIRTKQWAAMSIRVAIVDDDESVCRSLSRLLHAVGMEAACYHSAEAFLAERGRDDFDCLVLDIQLGGMSGLELQARLCAQGDPVPVVFITAHDTAASRREATLNGCAGFFRKTEPGTRVIEAIRNAAWCREDAQPGAAHLIKE